LPMLVSLYKESVAGPVTDRFEEVLQQPLSRSLTQDLKLQLLLDISVPVLNSLVFAFLKTTSYPLSKEDDFPLIQNNDVLVRDDIFRILEESGVGVPEYYKKVDFEVKDKVGQYSRSRSGCYFCFFQQKIEWVWLYENHPDRFAKAMEYEKDGYTWCQDEPLSALIQAERIVKIKEEYLSRMKRNSSKKSPYLVDILDDAEGEGCAACFI